MIEASQASFALSVGQRRVTLEERPYTGGRLARARALAPFAEGIVYVMNGVAPEILECEGRVCPKWSDGN